MHKSLFSFLILLYSLFIFSCKDSVQEDKDAQISRETTYNLNVKAGSLNAFIRKNKKYNDSIALLIDMKLHSGKNRFFVYDLKNDKIIDKGLVTHGSGSEKESGDGLIFKNIPSSYATSIGKYAIGYSYNGEFGKAYKMHGLDKTNDKAFERFIVFHSHECVPNEERKRAICQSQGCPTVSPAFFDRIAKLLDNSSKPVLMEIFYGLE